MTTRRNFLRLATSFSATDFGSKSVAATGSQGANPIVLEKSQTQAPLQLHYIDVGDGDPVVLIPGFTLSTDVFEKQIVALASIAASSR